MNLLRSIGRRLPSPAMIVAIVALFVALGGGATAGLLITGADVQDGSLTGRDVRNNSLLGRDLKSGTVTGSKIKNNSVRGRDIKDGDLQAEDFADGVLKPSYWAVVTADAQLDRGYGAASVSRLDQIPTGGYLVEFDEPIDQCAWVATAASAPDALTPIFGSFSILINLQSATSIGVFTFQNSANPALTDTPFHVVVHCGADEQVDDEEEESSNGSSSN